MWERNCAQFLMSEGLGKGHGDSYLSSMFYNQFRSFYIWGNETKRLTYLFMAMLDLGHRAQCPMMLYSGYLLPHRRPPHHFVV